MLDANVRDLLFLDFAGPHALLHVRRGGSTFDLLRMNPSVPTVPALVQSLASGSSISLSAPRRDGWMGFVVGAGGAPQRTQLATGTSHTASGFSVGAGSSMGWSAQGRMLFTSATAGTWTHSSWSVGGTPVTFATTTIESRVLQAN